MEAPGAGRDDLCWGTASDGLGVNYPTEQRLPRAGSEVVAFRRFLKAGDAHNDAHFAPACRIHSHSDVRWSVHERRRR